MAKCSITFTCEPTATGTEIKITTSVEPDSKTYVEWHQACGGMSAKEEIMKYAEEIRSGKTSM